MHIGVLAAIGVKFSEARIALISIGIMRRLPEMCFHKLPDGSNSVIGTTNTQPRSVGRGEHNKCMPICHRPAIFDIGPLPLPDIGTIILLVVGLKIGVTMRCPVTVMLTTGLLIGIYIIKDESGGTYQMAGFRIIDTAIISKMLEESTNRINDIRFIEGQN